MQPKRLEDARDCYQKALKLKLEAFGGNHIEVSNTLANASQVSRLEGKQLQAIDLLGQSLDCLLKSQGSEDESGQRILNDSLMKQFRAKSLQLASLLIKQEGCEEITRAEHILRNLVKLTIQSKQDREEYCQEDVVGEDPQLRNLLCQSLVASKDPTKCREAVRFLQLAKRSIDKSNIGKWGNLQFDLLNCAISRQLGEAQLCATMDFAFKEREAVLKEIKSLNLGMLEQTVEKWWRELQAKRGLDALKVTRLLLPVTRELLLHLNLAATYESACGTLDYRRIEELEKKLDAIRDVSSRMPVSARHEVQVLIERIKLAISKVKVSIEE